MIIDTEKTRGIWVVFNENNAIDFVGWNGLGSASTSTLDYLASGIAYLLMDIIVTCGEKEEKPSARALNELWNRIGTVLASYLADLAEGAKAVDNPKLKILPKAKESSE